MATLNAAQNSAQSAEHGHATLSESLRALRTTLVVAALCAMTLLWLIDYSFRELSNINEQRQDIETVRVMVEALTNNLTLAESTQRGFLLTGSESALALFDQAGNRVNDLLEQLDRKLEHTPMDGLAPDDFKQKLTDQLHGLQVAVALYRSGRKEAAQLAISSTTVEEEMQEVRDSGSKLLSQAVALLASKQVAFDRLINYSRLAFLACVLAVLFGFVLYTQQRYRLRRADMQRELLLQTERDRLETEVRARTRDLAELATHLQQAVEREREWLARELHDELGALMTAAKLDLARMRGQVPPDAKLLRERMVHLRHTLNDAVALKRRIMENLYPSALHNLGLVAALEILTREMAQRSGVEMRTQLQPVTLDADAQLTVYRVVQEALTNMAKHAQAGEAEVTLAQDEDAVHVTVSDNGAGFDPAVRRQGAHGLAGMRHRLLSCGGELDIVSSPGNGTRITARIPLQPPR
ncbi:MAG: ATP-binding protein [Ottowia sp.]|nr:CHASE3 domain-containing protein [Ottowia sp.]